MTSEEYKSAKVTTDNNRRIRALEANVKQLAESIDEINNNIKDLVNVFNSARTVVLIFYAVAKFIKWCTGLAVTGGMVYGIWYSWKHGLPMPSVSISPPE